MGKERNRECPITGWVFDFPFYHKPGTRRRISGWAVYEKIKRWGEGDSMANQKQSVLSVKGQHPVTPWELINLSAAAKSIRSGHTHMRKHALRRTLAFFLTYTQTQYSILSLFHKAVSAVSSIHSEFICTGTHRLTQNTLSNAFQKRGCR